MSDRGASVVLVESTDRFDSVTLNRPEHRNALDASSIEALHEYLDRCYRCRPNAVLIRGSGPSFCAGFDLSDLGTASDADLLYRFVRIELLLQKVAHAPFPVMAVAHGHAIGAGADLFCACTLRYATPDVQFRFPGWSFGLALGTRRLAQLIGDEAARNTLLENRRLDVEQAAELGLVQKCVAAADAHRAAQEAMLRVTQLRADAQSAILNLTRPDTRDSDLATLVRYAAQPGLRERITQYRNSLGKH